MEHQWKQNADPQKGKSGVRKLSVCQPWVIRGPTSTFPWYFKSDFPQITICSDVRNPERFGVRNSNNKFYSPWKVELSGTGCTHCSTCFLAALFPMHAAVQSVFNTCNSLHLFHWSGTKTTGGTKEPTSLERLQRISVLKDPGLANELVVKQKVEQLVLDRPSDSGKSAISIRGERLHFLFPGSDCRQKCYFISPCVAFQNERSQVLSTSGLIISVSTGLFYLHLTTHSPQISLPFHFPGWA